MSDTTGFLTPAAMEGHGFYNRSSRIQAGGLAPALPLMEQAARTVPLAPGEQPIVIADYGASQGRNSLLPVATAIRVLRERAGEKRAISVVHTDLPENDFTVLFQTVNGDPQSYLRGDAAVFPSAVGRSFYQQIFPSDSITLGWSSWAAHWLSRCPAAIPDQVQACFSADPGTRAAFARQAADDWVRFLAMRDGELCPGGRFVVLAMALDPASEQSFRALVDATYGGLIDLVDSGFLTRAEVHQMVIPSAPRTREEYLAPFAESGSFGSLRVEKMEIYPAEDVFWRDFEQTKDARRFGAGWAAFSRASAFPSLAKGLEPGGGDGRLAAFLSRLEDAMAARLALRPEPVLIPICKMLVAKDG